MSSVEGIQFVEHLDERENPCGAYPGCYQMVRGAHHVWYSSVAPYQVVKHERDHVLGMWHTPWVSNMFGRWCSTVTITGTAKYQAGQTICHDGEQEIVF
ncbi:MAG: hypothetical protein PHW66_09660 [Gallionella sp.]|nr:hypothetical protein [Gallionella sp.]